MDRDMEPKIREAEPRDAAALASLFAELGYPTSTQEISARLAEAGSIALVAVLDDRVVGVITTNVMPVLHRPRPVGRISSLVVAQDSRGAGVGRGLVAHAEELLASRGCGLVEITSNMRREQAHEFYKSLGYEATSYRFKKELDATPAASTSGGAAAGSNVRQAVPFFNVTDIEASLHFYVERVGFSITKQWAPEGRIAWCWLELGDAAVMLQEFRHTGLPRGTHDSPLGKGVSIYFICVDALAMYRDLTSRGVDARRPFVGNGMWVTSVNDPDGYALFFESPTDAAEESVYQDAIALQP
jgi:GNAT superfamily N-acetyltransferase